MNCLRCHSLMVGEAFEDLRNDTWSLSFQGWRCVICGEIWDPIIAANRTARPSPRKAPPRVKCPIQLDTAG